MRTDKSTGERQSATVQPGAAVAVSVGSLLLDGSPRMNGVDEQNIQRLSEVDGPLPPILVHRQTMRVIDGMHRLEVARRKRRTTIGVIFFDGDEWEAFYLGVEANTSHGLPLSLADRKAAAVRMIKSKPEMSDRAIAQWAGLAAKTVAKLRSSSGDCQQLNTRLGLDGRVRPLDQANGRRLAAEFICGHPEASLRDIARVAHVSIGTARDVRGRMRSREVPCGKTHTDATMHRETDSARPVSAEGKATLAAPTGISQRHESRAERLAQRLRLLQKDPSLRLTEAGRTLLKWMHLQVYCAGNRTSMAGSIPPHHARTFASMARECAQELIAFAEEIAERHEVPIR